MEYYHPEYRRQYCRERIARVREEYRRAQAPPKKREPRRRVPVIWAIWGAFDVKRQRAAYRPWSRAAVREA
jgi:hypothetical protein